LIERERVNLPDDALKTEIRPAKGFGDVLVMKGEYPFRVADARQEGESSATTSLNIALNRKGRKWSRSELFGRGLWEVLRGPLFGWTPRPLWAWRRFVLRMFGASIGRDVQLYPTVRIAVPWNLSIQEDASVGDRAILYSLGPIHIGRQATVSQGAHLCAGTHDFERSDMPLVKAPIWIGDGAWICADAFVGPGVRVGDYAILGARTVAMKNVADNMIVAGNPARVLRERPRPAGSQESNDVAIPGVQNDDKSSSGTMS
jgi:putative colanic acid biosynthesis acetyltransferase WcaF